MQTVLILGSLSAVLGIILLVIALRLRQVGKDKQSLQRLQQEEMASVTAQFTQEKTLLEESWRQHLSRYQSIVDVEAERVRIQADTQMERAQVLAELDAARHRTATENESQKAQATTAHTLLLSNFASEEATLRAALQRLADSQQQSTLEADALRHRVGELRTEMQALDERSELQSFGFYQYKYAFDLAASFQLELEHVRSSQKRMVSAKTAATCYADWTVNGSAAEGRKQTNQTLKLMLRAFNGECDAAVAKVKYNNVTVMEARIRKAYEVVNSLGVVQRASLAPAYLDLKLKELCLTHEYQEKLQAEKEEQRQIREQMREEELAQREILKAQLDAEKEEKRYADALFKVQQEVATAVGAKQAKLLAEIEQLELRLAQASTNKVRALSRAQLTRSGHVYIISNIGSFGEDVYKIGMTRRLEPMDRVRELGDASVPFHFDVHAIIYCEDAPTLENKLHRLFHTRRINQVNHRKEFFRVSLLEIAAAVRDNHAEIEFTLAAEAVDYRKTLSLLEALSQNTATSSPAF